MQNQEWLRKEQIDGWNAWFSIKKTLYYYLKSNAGDRSSTKEVAAPRSGKTGFFSDSLQFFREIIKQARGSRPDVILTDAENKLSRDESGNRVDVFVDPLIFYGIVTDYIYLETSAEGTIQRSGRIKNISNEPRKLPIYLLRKYFSRNKRYRQLSAVFAEKLNGHFRNSGLTATLSAESILLIISAFLAQVKWYSVLWKLVKPRRIFTVDVIPDGSIAAAKKLGIPVYEFQHGFITYNKADYVIPDWLKGSKQRMPVPAFIFVFGDYFRDLLLKSGFWEQNEVISIGSYVVEEARNKTAEENMQRGQGLPVLWTTQPSAFFQTKSILEDLAQAVPAGVHFYLKFHPRDTKANCEWYRDFCSRYPEAFSIEATAAFFSALKGKSLLVSVHSTTLLEALSVGCPAISIGSAGFKNGLNDLLIMDISHAIRPAEDVNEIRNIINTYIADPAYAEKWKKEALEAGKYFFAVGYKQNLVKYFSEVAIA